MKYFFNSLAKGNEEMSEKKYIPERKENYQTVHNHL
jgi:hypothetical protein